MSNTLHSDFFVLLTNNGHKNGFRNIVAWSEKEVRTLRLDEATHPQKPVIPIISYDYKNQVEKLSSANPCGYNTPDIVLVEPDVFSFPTDKELEQWLGAHTKGNIPPVNLKPRISRHEYLEAVKALKNHIQLGDIYEVNFCMEFYAENVELDAWDLFVRYNAMTKAPMAAYVKYNHLHLIGASPERFLKKENNRLLSQPIKGTRKRSPHAEEDERLKEELKNDPKERAENIMIVDLVRNDLSHIAQRGSVKVDELCGIYSFEQVHQSISTVSCTLNANVSFKDILRATFPMGSMTGAPKVRAMELIEQYESTKRQWYSGCVGYILPGGNEFDLNVIIRSMVYDQKNKYLSFEVGSAITIGSDPEKEYEECLLKAQAMIKILNTTQV